jgi:hypothetical protein
MTYRFGTNAFQRQKNTRWVASAQAFWAKYEIKRRNAMVTAGNRFAIDNARA